MSTLSSHSSNISPPPTTRPSYQSTGAPTTPEGRTGGYPSHQPYSSSSDNRRHEPSRGDTYWSNSTPQRSHPDHTPLPQLSDPSIISEIVHRAVTNAFQEIVPHLFSHTHPLEQALEETRQMNVDLSRRVSYLEQELSSRSASWHEQDPSQPSATLSQPYGPSQIRRPPPTADDRTPGHGHSTQRPETGSDPAGSPWRQPAHRPHDLHPARAEEDQSFFDNLSVRNRTQYGIEGARSHNTGHTAIGEGMFSQPLGQPGVPSADTASDSGRGWGKTALALGGAGALGGLVLLDQYANGGAYSTAALNGGRDMLSAAGTGAANLWRGAASGVRSLVGDSVADTLTNYVSAAGTGISTACSWIPFGAKLNGAVTAAGALASKGGLSRAARAGATTMAKQTVFSKAMGGLSSYFGASNGNPTPTENAGGSWMSYLPGWGRSEAASKSVHPWGNRFPALSGWGGTSNAKPASQGWFAPSRPPSEGWFGLGKAPQPSNTGLLSSWWSKPEPAQSSWFGSSAKSGPSGWVGGMTNKAAAASSAAASRRSGWWG